MHVVYQPRSSLALFDENRSYKLDLNKPKGNVGKKQTLTQYYWFFHLGKNKIFQHCLIYITQYSKWSKQNGGSHALSSSEVSPALLTPQSLSVSLVFVFL